MKYYFLLILVVIYNNLFCQDSTNNMSFNMEFDYMASIPLRKIIIQDRWMGPDDFASKFIVNQKLNLNNFAIKLNINKKYLFKNKILFHNIRLGLIHNSFKSIKEGGGGGGFTGLYCYGVSNEYMINEFFTIDYSISNNLILKKNIYIINEIGVNANILLYYKNQITWNGYYNDNVSLTSEEYSIKQWFSFKKPYYNKIAYLSYYKFGLNINICNKYAVTPYIEFPIFLFNTLSNKWGDITPRSITPYYTSIKNISLIRQSISIIYKF